jgi:hypothetical protein
MRKAECMVWKAQFHIRHGGHSDVNNIKPINRQVEMQKVQVKK